MNLLVNIKMHHSTFDNTFYYTVRGYRFELKYIIGRN
jgi:hypothetical protein